MTRSREVVVALAVLATACASTPPPATVPSAASATASPLPYPTAFSSELLAPMAALERCGDVEQPADVAEAQGLLLPDGSVRQQVDEAGDLIQVVGYVPVTPVQLLDHYLHRDDITIITLEHEQFESETLYETREHRVFVKAQVACATGSAFVAVIADDDAAASEVPTPSGAPG